MWANVFLPHVGYQGQTREAGQSSGMGEQLHNKGHSKAAASLKGPPNTQHPAPSMHDDDLHKLPSFWTTPLKSILPYHVFAACITLGIALWISSVSRASFLPPVNILPLSIRDCFNLEDMVSHKSELMTNLFSLKKGMRRRLKSLVIWILHVVEGHQEGTPETVWQIQQLWKLAEVWIEKRAWGNSASLK